MRKGSIIMSGLIMATLLSCAPLVRAQVTSEEFQKLKPQSKQLILPLPSGAVLQGKGLDDWLAGSGGRTRIIRGFGGSEKTEDQKFFALGGLYTSLLIQVHSPSTVDAAKGAEVFRQALVQLQAPEGFFSYLSELELMIKSQIAGPEMAGRFAGALQGFLVDFVRSRGESSYLNFQLGRWATTLALAARAQDSAGLQLSAASYFRERLAKAKTEKETLTTLEELEKMAGQQKLGADDFQKIENLAQRLRDQLS